MSTYNSHDAWEARYRNGTHVCSQAPNRFLAENLHRLARGGRALDLAMGEGRNALYLARSGFHVTGLDRSPTAVKRARDRAAQDGLNLDVDVVDLENHPLPRDAYDLVVVTLYLQRSLFVPIIEALRPGGMLVYETLTVGQLKYRPHNPAFLLQPGELRDAFSALEVLEYRETDDDERQKCTASLLARKPARGDG